MAQILDKTSKTVLVKLSIQEFKRINEFGIFDDEKKEDENEIIAIDTRGGIYKGL